MRHILITGGSRGIGAACVRAFAAKGDAVAFLYQSNTDAAAQIAKETGALALQADISDRASVEAAMAAVREQLGEVDVLVNCATLTGAA